MRLITTSRPSSRVGRGSWTLEISTRPAAGEIYANEGIAQVCFQGDEPPRLVQDKKAVQGQVGVTLPRL